MEAALRRVTRARSGDDARVRQRISAAGLPRRITLAGEWPPQSVGRAYRAADAFVLPSFHEGYGRWRSVDRLAELPRWAVERRLCRSCPWRRLALVPASIGPLGDWDPLPGAPANSLPDMAIARLRSTATFTRANASSRLRARQPGDMIAGTSRWTTSASVARVNAPILRNDQFDCCRRYRDGLQIKRPNTSSTILRAITTLRAAPLPL
jgi:hypothetical protein